MIKNLPSKSFFVIYQTNSDEYFFSIAVFKTYFDFKIKNPTDWIFKTDFNIVHGRGGRGVPYIHGRGYGVSGVIGRHSVGLSFNH